MTKQLFPHFKLQGEWAELLFMARAAELGLSIVRPWGDSSPYDVGLVSKQKAVSGKAFAKKRRQRPDLLRIQIKSTRCRHSAGAYKCHVDSNGVPYGLNDLDFIAAYVIPAKLWYIIPLAATHGQSEVLLAPNRPKSKYAKFKEAWHLLRDEPELCGSDILVRRL
jgi:hypothetical protein